MRIARLLILMALTALVMASAATAGAVEPIEGRWTFGEGVVEFQPSGAGAFAARNIEPAIKRCPAQPLVVRLTGSGPSYTGTVSYFTDGGCGRPVGNGSIEVTVAADGRSARVITRPPPGISCCGTDAVIRRVADATAELDGALPVIVNGILVSFQSQYTRLRATSGSGRRRALYGQIRSSAAAAAARVGRYPASPAEAVLKSCALRGIAKVGSAARAARRQIDVGAGLRAIAACLASSRNLFPGARPGVPAPRPDPRSAGSVYQGAGTDPSYVPRVEFDYDTSDATIRNIKVTVRTACAGRGVVYASAGPTDFGTVTVQNGARFGTSIFLGDLQLDFAGELINGGARGQIKVLSRPGAPLFCSSGGNRIWIAGRTG